MAYYSKEDVRKYINDNNDKIENRGHKSVTPVLQSLTQLDNEEDVVGFFWVDINEQSGDGAKVKIEGKTFIRVDFNLYTDDRFAIDLYQSQTEGITVTQVIKNRMIEQERAKKSIQENKENLESGLSEKLEPKK
jgi:hypothetical protein